MSTITRASAKSKGRKPSGLVDRVQATLPSRPGRSKRRSSLGGAVMGVLSTHGSDQGPTRSRTVPKKRVAGIAAGVGLGAAAVATRRHRAHHDGSGETAARRPTDEILLPDVIADS